MSQIEHRTATKTRVMMPCICQNCDKPFETEYFHVKAGQGKYCTRTCANKANGKAIQDSVKERFWSKVNKTKTCWLWIGTPNSLGYGRLRSNGKEELARRFSYRLHYGTIPNKLTLDHLCRNRLCVNPEHLEPVTRGENVLRGIGISAQNARKTMCKRGHPLAGDNLRFDYKGARCCRICDVIRQKRKNERQRIRRQRNIER